MTRIKSMHQDEWDDALWNSNHEHRKAKARKARHKGLQSSTIREGIEDYYERNNLKNNFSESFQEFDDYDGVNQPNYNPRV
ncbi:hypothetical protein [Endozoicomonas sp. ONNA2]|uniref:hypothetical protein n=1 Tax=Endozoicomonas sp. ONNA2 TaxID=2828741 RepID=UPI0021471D28|nr:hypothetical protein [Endozoicomonas sp. ONNA2]